MLLPATRFVVTWLESRFDLWLGNSEVPLAKKTADSHQYLAALCKEEHTQNQRKAETNQLRKDFEPIDRILTACNQGILWSDIA